MTNQRQLITALLTGLLVLQSVLAVAAPCDMSASDKGQMMMAMDSGDHTGHYMPAIDTASGDEAPNCCDDGYCSQNGCLSISALTDTTHGTELLPSGYSHSPLKTTLLDPLPNPLLRPPSA